MDVKSHNVNAIEELEAAKRNGSTRVTQTRRRRRRNSEYIGTNLNLRDYNTIIETPTVDINHIARSASDQAIAEAYLWVEGRKEIQK